jgi:hypothetical protein
MVALAYRRLGALLLDLSDRRKPEPDEFTASLLDAWSIVDSSFRLRHLARSIPGVKQQAPTMRLFQDRTKAVEDLRHFIQHANNEVAFLTERQQPFWGSISWLRMYSEAKGRVCVLKPGAFRETEDIPMLNPIGKSECGRLFSELE